MARSKIIWFEELTTPDIAAVGGKRASLGELISNLAAHGVNITRGFATHAGMYWKFVDANGLRNVINSALTSTPVDGLKPKLGVPHVAA
jgi:pyruvate,water dikinase